MNGFDKPNDPDRPLYVSMYGPKPSIHLPDHAVVELHGARVREARVTEAAALARVQRVVRQEALHVHIDVQPPEAVQDLIFVFEFVKYTHSCTDKHTDSHLTS